MGRKAMTIEAREKVRAAWNSESVEERERWEGFRKRYESGDTEGMSLVMMEWFENHEKE
jgi:hypothetical protein